MKSFVGLAGTLVAGVIALSACSGQPDRLPPQTAAKVNKEEITVSQIHQLLQQQRGVQPDQVDAVSRQILERLIDQELTLQKAAELRLDRDATVLRQVDAARREIVARAYLERIGGSATPPTPQEVERFYAEKPALFKQRRVYHLRQLSIEARPEQIDLLRRKLKAAKTIDDFVAFLQANGFRHSASDVVRAADELPPASVETFATMREGQAVLDPTPGGARVIVLAGSRSLPVELDRAAPAIERFLLNERKREIVARELKALRDAAKVEYIGRFAEAPVGALSAAAAPLSDTSQADIINQGAALK